MNGLEAAYRDNVLKLLDELSVIIKKMDVKLDQLLKEKKDDSSSSKSRM